MARNNHVFVMGDITGDIYFEREYEVRKKVQPYICVNLCMNGTSNTPAVKGLRVVAYGPLAELTYGFVQKGSRIAVIGYIQIRVRKLKDGGSATIVEVVADDIQFLKNVDREAGLTVWQGLVDSGQMRARDRDEGAPAATGAGHE
jgi:single-strand DNA-binding protein